MQIAEEEINNPFWWARLQKQGIVILVDLHKDRLIKKEHKNSVLPDIPNKFANRNSNCRMRYFDIFEEFYLH